MTHFSPVRFLPLLLLATMVGCGGNEDSVPASTAPTAESTRAQSASIGTAGGRVSATSSTGVTYSLFIPPGALNATTSITLTPLSSMGTATPLSQGTVAAVQMQPDGLTFKIPAQLRIENIAPVASGKQRVGFTSRNDGSTLRPMLLSTGATGGANTALVLVTHFSAAGSADATAAELAALPGAGAGTPAEVAADAVLRLPASATDAQFAEPYRTWYVTHIRAPLQAAAVLAIKETLTDADRNAMLEAIGLLEEYMRSREMLKALFPARAAGIDASLAAETAEARQLAATILVRLQADLILRCQSQRDTRMIELAALNQETAAVIGVAIAGSGLQRSDFLARVNDCLRVVFDPITLPTPLAIGTPRSLDARAQLLFNGATASVPGPLEFTVTPVDATVATARGNGDNTGRFTTVFTPSANAPRLQVKACLVLPLFDPVRGSDVCGVTEAAGPAGNSGTYVGTLSTSFDDVAGGVSRRFNSTLRIAIDANEQITVLEFTGSSTQSGLDRLSCIDPVRGEISQEFTSTRNGTVERVEFTRPVNAPLGVFTFSGFFDINTKSVPNDHSCPLLNVTDRQPAAGSGEFNQIARLFIQRIERTGGRISALDFNITNSGGTSAGRLELIP